MTNVEFKVTASPKRLHTVANLSLLLKNDFNRLEFFIDEHNDGAYWNYNRVFSDIGKNTTHIVTMEDDVWVCPDFVNTVKEVIKYRPNDVISLFYGRDGLVDAYNSGKSWMKIRRVGNQCRIIPKEIAVEYIDFCNECVIENPKQPPDNPLLAFLEYKGLDLFCTVPSFVQHIGVKSTFGTSEIKVSPIVIGDSMSFKDVDFGLGLDEPFVDDTMYRFYCIKPNTDAFRVLRDKKMVIKPRGY